MKVVFTGRKLTCFAVLCLLVFSGPIFAGTSNSTVRFSVSNQGLEPTFDGFFALIDPVVITQEVDGRTRSAVPNFARASKIVIKDPSVEGDGGSFLEFTLPEYRPFGRINWVRYTIYFDHEYAIGENGISLDAGRSFAYSDSRSNVRIESLVFKTGRLVIKENEATLDLSVAINDFYGTRDQFPGDLNDDFVVNFADFVILSQNYGKSPLDPKLGDIDQDGVVGFSDFIILSSKFGTEY